jgi:hypothetical protein
MNHGAGGIRNPSQGMNPTDDRVGVRHTPGDVGDDAPVPITGHMAAYSPHPVGHRQGWGGDVGAAKPGYSVSPNHPGNSQCAADQPPVPRKSAAAEYVLPRGAHEGAPILDNEQNPGPDQTADRGGKNHR